MALPATIYERRYVSQYATETIGFVLHKGGVPHDADGDVTVILSRTHEDTGDEPEAIATDTAEHPAEGIYEITLTSAETQQPGFYQVRWDYDLDGNPQSYIGYVEVGEAAPAYDALPLLMKNIVDDTWVKFADCFDSPHGGPNLLTYFQANYGRGRMAQLLQSALDRINIYRQPVTNYNLTTNMVPEKWHGVLRLALYVESIRHLIRSYVEQPDAMQVNVAYLNRKDYFDRWQTILAMEEKDFNSALDVFKISHMGLSRARVLASGGVFGSWGPTRLPYSGAARPRYWFRFY